MSESPQVPQQPTPHDVEHEAAPLPPGPVVVDASFVIGVLRSEARPAALAATGLLERSVLLSVTCAEVVRVMDRTAALSADVVTNGLVDLGVHLMDYPWAAASHIPDLVAIDRAADQRAQRDGTRRSQLSLGDLCVLGYAKHAGLPALTGDRHWAGLCAHGLTVPVHLY